MKTKHRVRDRTLPWVAIFTILLGAGVYAVSKGDQFFGVPSYGDGVIVDDPVEQAARALIEGEIPQEIAVSSDIRQLYKVAPDKPRFLQIDDLGIDARIVHLGITNSVVEAPANTNDVGWLKSIPNYSGDELIVIDGHLSGRKNGGVFYKLPSISNNQKITIEYGDGSKRNFYVSSKRTVARNATADAELFLPVSGPATLRLITCYGQYEKDAKTYAERYIVEAVER